MTSAQADETPNGALGHEATWYFNLWALSLFCSATCLASTALVNASVKSIFSIEVDTISILYVARSSTSNDSISLERFCLDAISFSAV